MHLVGFIRMYDIGWRVWGGGGTQPRPPSSRYWMNDLRKPRPISGISSVWIRQLISTAVWISKVTSKHNFSSPWQGSQPQITRSAFCGTVTWSFLRTFILKRINAPKINIGMRPHTVVVPLREGHIASLSRIVAVICTFWTNRKWSYESITSSVVWRGVCQ